MKGGHLRAALLLVVLFLSAVAVYLLVLSAGKRSDSGGFEGVLDVNTASVGELDRIPYMTPQMAGGIVNGRPWSDLDDLVEVLGIGEKTLERVRPHLEIQE